MCDVPCALHPQATQVDSKCLQNVVCKCAVLHRSKERYFIADGIKEDNSIGTNSYP